MARIRGLVPTWGRSRTQVQPGRQPGSQSPDSIALDLLGNSLSPLPSHQNAEAAWKLLEEARAVPVKIDRERVWLDAVRAYFRNHDSVPVAERAAAAPG